MHIVEPGRCTYYIDDVQFTDDPRVRAAKVEKSDVARAGSGLVTPTKDSHGVWQATRDIHLGRNVPGYDQCGL
jgi:protocatechuate 3,4-dioxygenase beta subunit